MVGAPRRCFWPVIRQQVAARRSPHNRNGAEPGEDSGQLVPSSDRGRGMARPIRGAGGYRSFLRREEVPAHPPPGSPCAQGRRRSVVEKEVKPLSNNQLHFGAKSERENQKFFKYFFILSRPCRMAI